MAIVLAYHRVGQGDDGWWGMRVSERNFAEQLELLRRDWEPCSLAEALTPPTHLPDRRVAVTFDDGYVDNLTTAAPMMLEAGVPGHLFVATGFMERRQGYWWDALADTRRELFPFDGAEGFDREAFIETWNRLRRSSVDERATLLASLSERTRGSFDLSAEGVLDVDGIRELRRMGMGIGAHSVWHPLLPALPIAAVVEELVGSKRALESILGEPVHTFAYPFGEGTRISAVGLRLAGFRAAFTTDRGAVGEADPRFLLPRVSVKDWGGDELSRMLEYTASESAALRGSGEGVRLPMEYLESKTGELSGEGVACLPVLHAPGHCLFGLRVRAVAAGDLRVRFHLSALDGAAQGGVSCELYLPSTDCLAVARRVDLAPGDFAVDLTLRAQTGVQFEPRVYWDGRGPVRVSGIEVLATSPSS